jgi:hypothetical protein
LRLGSMLVGDDEPRAFVGERRRDRRSRDRFAGIQAAFSAASGAALFLFCEPLYRKCMTPLALTDQQLHQIQDLARLIPPWRRDEYLRELALRLRDVEVGDGVVHRIAARCLRDVLARPRTARWLDGSEDDRA